MEDEPAYGLLCRIRDRDRVAAALAPLRVAYQQQATAGSALFHGFRIQGGPGRGIGPDKMTIRLVGNTTGRPGDLVDGSLSTGATWKGGAVPGSLEIDLGRERMVSGLWLFAPKGAAEGTMQGLPVRYQVSAAGADRVFKPVLSFASRVDQAYVQGNHVYVSGYFGRAECRFPARSIRSLRLSLAGNREVRLGEIVLFEEAGPWPDTALEAERIVALLEREQARFTVADRWLSAVVIKAMAPGGGRLPALPRFNPRADDQEYSRLLVPAPGLVLAPARGVADMCERQLLAVYGRQAIRRRLDMAGYSLFFLDRAERRPGQGFLYWNGHLLLRLQDYGDLATIALPRAGLPSLEPGRGKTSGFYHDGWTNGLGVFRDRHLRLDGVEQTLVLVTGGNTPHGGDPDALGLRVEVNGAPLRFLRRQGASYLFALPPGLKEVREVRIASRTFVPATRDRRTLGVDVVRLLFP